MKNKQFFKTLSLNKALLTAENSKLGPLIKNFPISLDSCQHKTKHCSKYCYGKRGNHRFNTTKTRYDCNYAYSLRPDFAQRMSLQVQEAVLEGYRFIRLHAMGDIYNLKYYQKWLEIASRSPEMTILAYTRNYEINFKLAPPNLRLFYSVDPSTKIINPTAKRFAYVIYNQKHGASPHLAKYKQGKISGKICNGLCKACKYCFKTEGNVIFPARNAEALKTAA